MISKGKKDVAVVMAAGGFMKASIPFLVFYFSAQILNNAIEGDYEACVKSVAALLLSQFVCELVNRFCQKRIKQKTAYEIVDCDWSSDVCSSDLEMGTSKTRWIPVTRSLYSFFPCVIRSYFFFCCC